VGDGRIFTLADQFTFLEQGALFKPDIPASFAEDWLRARAETF